MGDVNNLAESLARPTTHATGTLPDKSAQKQDGSSAAYALDIQQSNIAVLIQGERPSAVVNPTYNGLPYEEANRIIKTNIHKVMRIFLASIFLCIAAALGLLLGDSGAPSRRLLCDACGALTFMSIPLILCSQSNWRRWDRSFLALGMLTALLVYGLAVAFLKQPSVARIRIGDKRNDLIEQILSQVSEGRLYGHGNEVASIASITDLEIYTTRTELFLSFRSLRTLHDGGFVKEYGGRAIREGGVARQYDGMLSYSGTYMQNDKCLEIRSFELKDYSFAPTATFWSRLFGWIEIDYMMRKHSKTYEGPLLDKFRKLCPE